MIKHFPVTNKDKVCKHYSEKDCVPIKYVCTTDFNVSDRPADIFYRETAHPEFGNKYFGIVPDYETGGLVIFKADKIENFTFGMVENDEGDLEYSQYHHDCKVFKNGNMIDGGRQYIRSSLNSQVYIIHDGEMVLRNTNE